MPSHSMSCFKMPQSLCSNIQSALTRFWWDDDPDHKKVSWISWDRMAKPKKKRGLGFKDITSTNDALLVKIGRHIIKNPTCLLAKVLLGKYCHSEDFLLCSAPKSASHGWKSVLIGRDLLLKQLGWMVGSGTSINIWKDPWLAHNEQTYRPSAIKLPLYQSLRPIPAKFNGVGPGEIRTHPSFPQRTSLKDQTK